MDPRGVSSALYPYRQPVTVPERGLADLARAHRLATVGLVLVGVVVALALLLALMLGLLALAGWVLDPMLCEGACSD